MEASAMFLHLYFAGLIAFVPTPDDKGMHVLLLDGQGDVEVDGCMSPPHEPFLVVPSADVFRPKVCPKIISLPQLLANENINGPDVVFCAWPLKDVRIVIEGLVEGQGFEMVRGQRERPFIRLNKIPENGTEAKDLSWLANMDDVLPDGGKLRAGVGDGSMHDEITADLELREGVTEVCRLVDFNDSGLRRVSVFDFHRTGTHERMRYSQALADVIRTTSKMQSRDLIIQLVNSSGGVTRIKLISRFRRDLDVLVVNMPPNHTMPTGDCQNKGTDFVRFFSIAHYSDPSGLPGGALQVVPVRTRDTRDSLLIQPTCEKEATTLKRFASLNIIQGVLPPRAGGHHATRKDRVLSIFKRWLRRGEDFSEFADFFEEKSLESRPICPMIQF